MNCDPHENRYLILRREGRGGKETTLGRRRICGFHRNFSLKPMREGGDPDALLRDVGAILHHHQVGAGAALYDAEPVYPASPRDATAVRARGLASLMHLCE